MSRIFVAPAARALMLFVISVVALVFVVILAGLGSPDTDGATDIEVERRLDPVLCESAQEEAKRAAQKHEARLAACSDDRCRNAQGSVYQELQPTYQASVDFACATSQEEQCSIARSWLARCEDNECRALLQPGVDRSCAVGTNSPASNSAPGITHCLADGRSFEFELLVRERVARNVEPPFHIEPGLTRVRHQSGDWYEYVGEYVVVLPYQNSSREERVEGTYWGRISATTCQAELP